MTIFPTLFSFCVYFSVYISFVPFSLLFQPLLFRFVSHSLQSLFVSNLFLRHYQPRFLLSLPLPFSLFLSHTTSVSVTAGRLVDLSLSSHPLTSMPFPSLLLTDSTLRTALAASLPLKKAKKKGPSLGLKRFLFSVKTGPTRRRLFILFQRLKQHNHKQHKRAAQPTHADSVARGEKKVARDQNCLTSLHVCPMEWLTTLLNGGLRLLFLQTAALPARRAGSACQQAQLRCCFFCCCL